MEFPNCPNFYDGGVSRGPASLEDNGPRKAQLPSQMPCTESAGIAKLPSGPISLRIVVSFHLKLAVNKGRDPHLK